jgi:hypothetical protein
MESVERDIQVRRHHNATLDGQPKSEDVGAQQHQAECDSNC